MPSIRKRGHTWRAETHVEGKRTSKTFKTQALAVAWAERQECRTAGMPLLRAALSEHRILPLIPKRFKDAVDRANYTEREILACAFPIQFESGVYFLIRDHVITYIGQTTCVLRRILKHSVNGKVFDSFAFIPAPLDQMAELEQVYIALLLPPENQRMN